MHSTRPLRSFCAQGDAGAAAATNKPAGIESFWQVPKDVPEEALALREGRSGDTAVQRADGGASGAGLIRGSAAKGGSGHRKQIGGAA